MFIQVRLLNGFQKPLWYKWEKDTRSNPIGTVVRVPLRNQIASAVVTYVSQEPPIGSSFAIKPITSLEHFPEDPDYYSFITNLGRYYQTDPVGLIQLPRYFLKQKKETETRVLPIHSDANQLSPIALTSEQQYVTDALLRALNGEQFYPALLHGVTGSGKTEVYKKLIECALSDKKSVLLLLPEVTLALRVAEVMKRQLTIGTAITSFHSASSTQEKRALWQRLLHKEPTLIIGVHMPVLLPISKLGLIIVDEEHEVGYQEKKHPKINSKDAALIRAHRYKIPILLGSATPSISSLYNVKHRGWHFFQLKERFAGTFSTVSTVFLNKPNKKRRNFWISAELDSAIQSCLARHEQAIIFINRRGYSFFVQCSACTFIFSCNNCSVSLTLHDGNTLSCHYCGIHILQPTHCSSCQAPETSFIKKGIGTQQVVSILQRLFPLARIGRADMDITLKKKKWQETVTAFQRGILDILVGTQTIAKGFHFENVTLVGIVWADLNVHFPLYNASETSLQQLLQVAGRAGRQKKGSQVIVQAMANHRIFLYLNEIDYLKFYSDELQMRSVTNYPPVGRLAEIELKNKDPQQLDLDAACLAEQLHALTVEGTVTILGPAYPPVHMIQNMHKRKIYLKSSTIEPIISAFEKVDFTSINSAVFFTPNPTS